MQGGKRMALGLAGGYLLGRRKKRGLLLLAAALLAGRGAAGGLARRGAALGSAELQHLADQGRQAVRSLLSNGVEALADRIHDKTEALRGASGEPDGPRDRPEPGDEGKARAPEGEAAGQAAGDRAATPEDREADEEAPEGPEDEYGGPEPDEEEEADDGRQGGEPARPRLSGARRGPVTRNAERGRRNVASGPARR